MRILVTGVAGFVGRHVAELALIEGHEVIGVGHGVSALRDAPATWVEGSISSEMLDLLDEVPGAIIHCAGSSSVARSFENSIEDFRRTVESALVVFEYARKRAGEVAVVLPSSAAVYGFSATLPTSPEDSPNPTSPYGLHKAMVEDIASFYGSKFGVPSAVVRLFSIYGCGLTKQLLWDACEKLSAGNAQFSGTGQESRDWLHVTDAARLLIAAAAHASIESPVVNGGSGTSTTVEQVLHKLSEGLGVPSPTFSGEVRPGDPPHYLANISTAKRWGWSPMASLDVGIKEYVTWYNSRLSR